MTKISEVFAYLGDFNEYKNIYVRSLVLSNLVLDREPFTLQR